MKDDKKQEQFHESLLKILYPPPPSPPEEDKNEENENKLLLETLYHLPEDLENEERHELSSSNDESEVGNGGSVKLTRAQRKRLRKKKLKEAASQRRKIIGPLLPGSPDEGSENVSESVGQKASVEICTIAADTSGEPASSAKQNKLKQRRKSKKLVDEDLKSSTVETSSRTGPES